MGNFADINGNFSGDFTMSAPFLPDISTLVKIIPPEYAFFALIVTGSLLIFVRDWRISIGALILQYLAMGVSLGAVVRVEIAFAKMLVGLFIGLLLYFSARQAGWQNRLTFSSDGLRALGGIRFVGGEVFPPGRVFRLLLTLLILVVSVSLAQSYPLDGTSNLYSILVYWLLMVGVVLLILSENPLKVGQGLLTFFMGFELWYTPLDSSLLLVGLLGAVNLLLALAVGYLGIIRGI